MKKNLFKLFQMLCLVLILLFLFNCQEPSSSDGSNKSDKNDDNKKESISSVYWKSSYGDSFEIFESVNFYQYDDDLKNISFAGVIVNNPDFNLSSNYITVKITDSGTWGKTVGNYYVVHYKNKTDIGIQESCAYKSGGYSDIPIQADAEAEFTVANGYFAYYGDYERQ